MSKDNFLRLGERIFNLRHIVQIDAAESCWILYLADGRSIRLNDDETDTLKSIINPPDQIDLRRKSTESFKNLLGSLQEVDDKEIFRDE